MQYLKDAVKEKILSAAITEFTEHGYSEASVRNIAYAAKVSIGNIYRYFQSKQDIYSAVVSPFFEEIKENCGRTQDSAEKHIEIAVETIFKHKEVFQILRKSAVEKDCFYGKEIVMSLIECYMEENAPFSFLRADSALLEAVSAGFTSSFFIMANHGMAEEKLKEEIAKLILFYFKDIHNRTLNL